MLWIRNRLYRIRFLYSGHSGSGSDRLAFVPLNPKDLVTIHITTVEICSRAPATILQTKEQTALQALQWNIPMICGYIDEGVLGIGMGPLATDSTTKLKRSQLNVCTKHQVRVLCLVYSFPPAAEICARLAGNLSVVDNSKVSRKWYGLAVCLIFHSELEGGRGRGGVEQLLFISLHYRDREGGSVPSPWYIRIQALLNPDPDQDPGFYITKTKTILNKFCVSLLWPPWRTYSSWKHTLYPI